MKSALSQSYKLMIYKRFAVNKEIKADLQNFC
jgi:hypothetical protein